MFWIVFSLLIWLFGFFGFGRYGCVVFVFSWCVGFIRLDCFLLVWCLGLVVAVVGWMALLTFGWLVFSGGRVGVVTFVYVVFVMLFVFGYLLFIVWVWYVGYLVVWFGLVDILLLLFKYSFLVVCLFDLITCFGIVWLLWLTVRLFVYGLTVGVCWLVVCFVDWFSFAVVCS